MTQPIAGSTANRDARSRFERPVFIISTPRSGSTLLFETLERAPGLYTTGNESHGRIESVPGLAPWDKQWHSNRLTAADASAEVADQLARNFLAGLVDREGQPPPDRFRMLEKTPKNALRVPFFDAVFPDGRFIFLYRDCRETLSSMIEAWLSGRFRTYPRLPGWRGPTWSMLLVPGWQSLKGMELPEIVARQWAITMSYILDDLGRIPAERLAAVDYGRFLTSPQPTVEALAVRLGIDWDRTIEGRLPLSKTTVSQPAGEKWRRIEPVLEAIWPIVAEIDARAREFIDKLQNDPPA